MRTPLSVYVLYHTENKEGSRIYSELYSLLCRDVNNPFLDGLDIPVYFVTVGKVGFLYQGTNR